jgi:hypothetical protein
VEETSMNIKELIERLDDLSWQEQMNFEMSERNSEYAHQTALDIEGAIRKIASETTSILLDQLEQEEEYVVWALRLSPHVSGDKPSERGKPYLKHSDSNVRFWAELITSTC